MEGLSGPSTQRTVFEESAPPGFVLRSLVHLESKNCLLVDLIFSHEFVTQSS